MNTRTRTRMTVAAAAVTALALVCGNAQAQPRWGGYHGGYHGHYHRGGGWGPGPFWGGIGLGLGLGIGTYYLTRPDVVIDAPPTVYYTSPPVTVQAAPQPVPPAATSSRADPIFYPRNGQSAAQTEADRRDCNRWATSQPGAVADASIFQRATLACMDGRGYTSR